MTFVAVPKFCFWNQKRKTESIEVTKCYTIFTSKVKFSIQCEISCEVLLTFAAFLPYLVRVNMLSFTYFQLLLVFLIIFHLPYVFKCWFPFKQSKFLRTHYLQVMYRCSYSRSHNARTCTSTYLGKIILCRWPKDPPAIETTHTTSPDRG